MSRRGTRQYETSRLVDQFRFNIKELERHLDNPTEQSLIACSAILRKILLSDQNGLLGELGRIIPGFRTRNTRRFVKFHAAILADSHIRDLPSGGYAHLIVKDDEIAESTYPGYNRDKFLQLPVKDVKLNNGQVMTVTIRDVINFVANKLGGVHFDLSSLDTKHQVLYALDEKYQFSVASSVVSSIKGISEIVLATCKRVDGRLIDLGY